MKFSFSVILLAAVLTVVSAGQPEKLKNFNEHFIKVQKECDADPATRIDPASIRRVKSGTVTDEDKLAYDKNEFCVNVKLGVQKQNGDYDTDNIRKRLEEGGVDKTKIDKMIAKCGTRPAGTSAVQAAGLLSECLFGNKFK